MENGFTSSVIQIVLIGLATLLGIWIIRRIWVWLLIGALVFLLAFHGSCPPATSTIGVTG